MSLREIGAKEEGRKCYDDAPTVEVGVASLSQSIDRLTNKTQNGNTSRLQPKYELPTRSATAMMYPLIASQRGVRWV